MGLPLFVTPTEPEPAARVTTEKLFSNVRSSIRRHRHRSAAHTDPAARYVTSIIRRRWSPEAFLDSGVGQHEASAFQGQRLPNVNSSAVAPNFRNGTERMRLRDSISFERHPIRSSDNDTLSLPLEAPEPTDRTEAEDVSNRTARSRENRNLRRTVSRFGILASSRESEESSTRIFSREDIDLTDSYAENPEYRLLIASLYGVEAPNHPTNISLPLRAYTPISSSLLERIRALNRTSTETGRSHRNPYHLHMDGLGDRNRSLSPESGAAWQTLLTSISPDSQPLRDGTSISSATATATATATASTFTHPPRSAAVPPTSSIISLPPPSTTTSSMDSESLPYASHISSTSMDPDYEDTEDPQEERGFTDINSMLESLLNRPDAADIEGLPVWHYVISRLTEREDIPDEWWASAGLSRNIRETSGT
ncbi:hypothetical protein K3495_g202 [Podosphaera aphanis]|nr:hypothetical protein K3495_g202 [Podosphaera aphanis]